MAKNIVEDVVERMEEEVPHKSSEKGKEIVLDEKTNIGTMPLWKFIDSKGIDCNIYIKAYLIETFKEELKTEDEWEKIIKNY